MAWSDKDLQNLKAIVLKKPLVRVNLTPISDNLFGVNYVSDLFQDLIFESHPIIKFHILYQIIEMSMERILFNEVEILSKKLKAKKIFAIDFKDKITTFESESKRINKLFSEYAIGLDKIITNDLLQACENFLQNKMIYINSY